MVQYHYAVLNRIELTYLMSLDLGTAYVVKVRRQVLVGPACPTTGRKYTL